MTGIIQGLLASIGSAVASAASDAYFNLVTLLLNTSSTNGAQNNTFLDSSTNNFTITRNGNTTQGSFSPFSQTGWSNYFNGSDGALSISSTNALAVGTGDFTLECWFYLTATPSTDYGLIAGTASSSLGFRYGTANNSANGLGIYRSGVADLEFCSFTFAANTWYHVAVTRQSNVIKFWVNGTQQTTAGSGGASYNFGNETTTLIASTGIGGVHYFPGYISNARVNKTTAVYTSNFTPSTTPLTAISGTSILTCQNNRFIDNSANAFTITPNGTPSVQAFSPFLPTAAYDAAVVGGSGYFDGSGDYLTAASNSAFAFGTGSFTWETWFYSTGAVSRDVCFYDLGSGNTTGGFAVFTTGSTLYVRIDGANDLTYSLSTISSAWLNSWHHLAVVRNGTTLTIYLDGVSVASGTRAQNVTQSSPYIGNGAGVFSGYPFLGYLSGMRVVKGTAVYTAAFTPPTAPLTAISGTSLLLSGTNAGIYDSAAKNVLETVGNAQVSTTQAKFGTTSMYFDGTGDYLLMPKNPLLVPGSGDFSWEAWIYNATAAGSLNMYFDQTGGGLAVYRNSSGYIVVEADGVAGIVTSANTIPVNQWVHLAVTRAGNTARVFINGVLDASATNTTNIAGSSAISVGANPSGFFPFNGYIDDLRFTKGYARYTATFTPPAAAFPIQ